MKSQQIKFMALGGGQRVGASCYYMGLGNNHILLDCGIGYASGIKQNPVLNALLGVPGIYSLSQLSEIYISHAHLDHSGYLPEMLHQLPNTKIYMTELTRRLLRYQYSEENYQRLMHLNPYVVQYILEALENRCCSINYAQKIPFKEYEVEFLSAGHIPGAMMTLFRYGGKNILYTGDYAVEESLLTGGCDWPRDNIDLMVICGLHAKHPLGGGGNIQNAIQAIKGEIQKSLWRGENIYCQAPQLSKGIEILAMLNEFVAKDIKIYIDEGIYNLIGEMETFNLQMLQRNNYRLSENSNLYDRCIVLSARKKPRFLDHFSYIKADYSLHDTFENTLNFIKKINPQQAVIVHSPNNSDCELETVEQRLMYDAECRTQFLFPEEQELYSFF